MSTDLEIYKAELKRAQELGLDINKLDLEAISDMATGQAPDLYEARQYYEAMIESDNDVNQFIDDDNLYLHFGIPKTEDKELNRARLRNSLSNTGDFNIKHSLEGIPETDMEIQERFGKDPFEGTVEPNEGIPETDMEIMERFGKDPFEGTVEPNEGF